MKSHRLKALAAVLAALAGFGIPAAAGADEDQVEPVEQLDADQLETVDRLDTTNRVLTAQRLDVVSSSVPGDLATSVLFRTDETSVVTIGDTAWVTVSIRGQRAVDNLRFTANVGEGGSVSYPANTEDHSGPYNGYDLDIKETDYVAFKVTIPDGVTARAAELKLSVTWTDGGQPFKGETSVKIPLVQFDGAAYTLLTESVTLTEKDNGWVALSFAGLAPRVEQLEVSIASPSGLDIYYPLETYTSLQGDSLLEDGETDVARFRLNEASWGQTLDLEVTVKYLVAGEAKTNSHKVQIAA